MKNSAGPGKCVHCRKEVEERNWDHVFPESWYPDTTPVDIEKWKAPSCIECNREYGKIEQDLLIQFGLCLDPNHPNTKKIVEKALRSVKPEFGRNVRDKSARAKKQKELLGRMLFFDELPEVGLFPNFGPQPGQKLNQSPAVLLPKSHLEKLAEKIVRGIFYVEYEDVIDGDYELEVFVVEDHGAKEFMDLVNNYGKELNRGPGISIRRAVLPEDPKSGVYAIVIWERAKLYASILPKE